MRESSSVVTEVFTEKSFKKRECVRITPTSVDPERCGCGRRVSDHPFANQNSDAPQIASPTGTWTIESATKEYPTDAYGVIEFQGGSHPHKAQFVRLAFDSKPEDVLRLLEERWKLGRPKLVISIIGSVNNFDLQPKLAKVFGQGLVKAVRTTGAWIICSGVDSGVAQHIASAFATCASARVRRKSVLIGIAPWGMLKNRDDFIVSKQTRQTECQVSAMGVVEGAIVSYHSRGQWHPRSRYAALLETFTHVLLVDDGSTHRYGADHFLRRRLEEYIRQQLLTEASQKHVPVVGVLLKGGAMSLRTVLDFVTNMPALPVVVVDGTGGAADLIGMTERLNENQGEKSLTKQAKTSIMGKIEAELGMKLKGKEKITGRTQSEQKLADLVFTALMMIARRKKKINIFRLGETSQDFDNALLTGLLKAQLKMPFADRLALTLTWNRPDIAIEYVFPETTGMNLSILEANMIEALVHDRVEFVQLLLANGVSMEKFLTKERLVRLYNKTQSDKASTLLAAMYEVNKQAYSLGYQYTLPDIGACMRRLMGGTYDASHYRQGKLSRHPFNDLFIWAVLTKRHNMALCMWRNGYGPMPKALAAIKLNDSLSKEAADEPNADEICADFDRHAEDFRRLSLQLLSQCYRLDDEKTSQLLTREIAAWGNETCLTLAVRAGHKEFIAHPACQALLSDLWQGGLHMGSRMNLMVLLAVLIPPALFVLDYKTKEELMLQAQRSEERKDSAKELPPPPPAEVLKNVASIRAIGRAAGVISLKCAEKVYEFYAAPITKFWVWTLAYLIFLVIFTWFILLATPEDIDPTKDWKEVYILAYAAAFFFELLREMIMEEPKSLYMKFKAFKKRRWNLVSLIGVLMVLFTPIARYGYVEGSARIPTVRLLYAVNVVIWYARLLEIMTVHKTCGPYIIMFAKTLYSFLELAIIFAILIASYGLTVTSIVKTHDHYWQWGSVRDIFFRPYFMIFGEVWPDFIDECGDKGENCVPGFWLRPLCQAAYLLVMNALLLNLLIATFTNIFTVVKTGSLTIWKYYRYHNIMQYEHKPLIPPPFCIISHVVGVFKYAIYRCCCRRDARVFDQALKLVLNDEQTRMILDFESEAMDELNSRKDIELAKSQAERIARSDDKSEFVNMKLDDAIARTVHYRDIAHAYETLLRRIDRNVRVLKVRGSGTHSIP